MSAAELDQPQNLPSGSGTHSSQPLRQAREDANQFFTSDVPRKVLKHAAAGNLAKEWDAWATYLTRRRSHDRLAVLARKFGPEIHFLGRDGRSTAQARLGAFRPLSAKTAELARTSALEALQPLLSSPVLNADEDLAYLALFAAYNAAELSSILDRDRWWSLIESLYQIALDSVALDLTAQPVLHQLCAGELHIALACRLGEIAPLSELWRGGRRALSAGIEELLDDEGLPHARCLALQQALVGSWARVKLLTSNSRELPWDDDCEAQFPLAVRELLRLHQRGGRRLFEPAVADGYDAKHHDLLLAAAVDATRSKPNRQLLEIVLPRRASKVASRLCGPPPRHSRLTPPSNHSEWAQTAILQRDWRRSSPRLVVTYADRAVQVDLAIGREALLAGAWAFAVNVDGLPANPTQEWEQTCFVSDDDADYLELEIPLEHGLSLQRQICLARRDEFLFLADAVIGEQKRAIHYRGGLPLVAGLAVEPADKTRELSLSGKKLRALAMPLELGEWRTDRRGGELSATQQRLELTQQTLAPRLYAPLWIDLAPRRRKKDFTWRKLTVAEQLQIQPRAVAAGYRVQFGAKQWLVYRSLAERGNRTLLGHNLSTEFLIAQFRRDGKVKPLIEIE